MSLISPPYICGFIFSACPFLWFITTERPSFDAVGDTKRPLMFLIIAGVINAVLNMFLVIAFHHGCGRCCHCHSDLTDDFLYSGAAMPV